MITVRVPTHCRICEYDDAGKDGLCNVCGFLSMSIREVEREREAKTFLIIAAILILVAALGGLFSWVAKVW